MLTVAAAVQATLHRRALPTTANACGHRDTGILSATEWTDQPLLPRRRIVCVNCAVGLLHRRVAARGSMVGGTISHIRGTDGTGVVDTLLARGLIADDARFSGRGRPSFLVTTERFLQVMGIGSLAELPAPVHRDRA